MTPLLSKLWSALKSRRRNNAGQALIEMTFVVGMLVALLFGLIDFGRAILTRQIIVNLSREAANLASRGTPLSDALAAVATSGKPLDINAKGKIILTVVTRDESGQAKIVDQQFVGGATATSKIGRGKGNPAYLPNNELPTTNQTLVAAEVYYQFVPITPIGKLLEIDPPKQLYDAAYF